MKPPRNVSHKAAQFLLDEFNMADKIYQKK